MLPDSTAGGTHAEGLYRYVVLATSLVMMVAGTGSVYLLVSALKPISAELDWPRTVPSVAYALQYLGGGLGGIVMGYWMDRSGMAKPALLGAVMIGVGACLTHYVQAPWHLFAIYGIMMGLVGRATLFAPLMVNITHWFEHRRGMAVGIVGSGQAIAGAMWPAVFQYGISTVGWRETALAYGIFALCLMVPLSAVFARPRPQSQAKQAAVAERATTAAVPPALMIKLLCTAIIGCCVAMSLPLAHLMSHASDIGFDPIDGAQLLSVMLLCAAISSMFGLGALSHRFGPLKALLLFSCVQATMLGFFPLLSSLTGLYITAALFGLGYGGILPSYPIIIRAYMPAQGSGARTGLVVFFGTVGMAIGSGLGGVSIDLTGSYAPAFFTGVVFNIVNIAIISWLILRLGRGTGASGVSGVRLKSAQQAA